MRRLQCALFVAVAAIGSASIASAADLPVKAPPVFAAPVTGPLWEGLYIGANVGDTWSHSSWCTDAQTVNCGSAHPTDTITGTPRGLVGGGQFGDRWQWGNVVVGLEGMIDGLTMSTTQAGPPGFAGQTLTTKFSGLSSATAQVGLAFDRFLAYGKGGWALTDEKLAVTTPAGNLIATEYVAGWTAGGGLEYQLMPHLIVGVEYDYYRFTPNQLTNITSGAGNVIGCGACNFGSSTNMQTLLGRISFQAGPMPSIR